MKEIKYLVVLLCVVLTSAHRPSINDAECSKGITFWCEHIMNAKKCNAVDFCIQSVWENHLVQIDSTPLCDDCKQWVTQARDLLEKKETAEEIIRTLDWSCSLCPYENGRSRCEEIIKNNVNEILKLLESQMNPDAVCSAIHLCNNRMFTQMFESAYELEAKQKNEKLNSRQKLLPFTCGQCNHIGSLIQNKLAQANHDDVLEGVLKLVCSKMSSFSDSCSNVVIKNFNEIYQQLPKMITKKNLCQASCKQQYQNEGIVDISPDFDNAKIPCELCEQLMLHLREVLIANTSEIEFKNILEGFCSQMPTITDECNSIVDQYYDTIYNYLVNGLDANKTCVGIGICTSNLDDSYSGSSMPLLSSDLFPAPAQDSIEVHTVTKDASVDLYEGTKLCTACEYTMNLVQIELEKHGIQENILQRVRAECKKLPAYIRQCEDTIDAVGDEIMNAIYHGMNPRLICPLIKMCPPNLNFEYLQATAVDEKPTCPFCLFAMQEIRDMVSSNTSKANVEKVLDQLCTHLSAKLKSQCMVFVKEYSSEVVDMILANFTPQEACVFIKLCTQEAPKLKRINIVGISNDSDQSIEEDFVDFDDDSKLVDNSQCELCKALIKLIEQRVIDIKSKDEIRRELENSCHRLKKFSKECIAFVDKYSDRIVDLVSKELAPEQVCRELIFCVTEDEQDLQDYDVGLDILSRSFSEPEEQSEEIESTGCLICEFVMTKCEEELNDTQRTEDIKHVLKNICSKMPSTVSRQCSTFIDYYYDMIIVLIETTKPSEMCQEMKLCPKSKESLENQLNEIQKDIYTCAVCRGVVESLDTIIEDPQVDTRLEELEEKICEKFAGKFKQKCQNLASTYGIAIINLMKNLTESDQICYKLELCSLTNDENSGMARLI